MIPDVPGTRNSPQEENPETTEYQCGLPVATGPEGERRAALLALPYAGRVDRGWVECTACNRFIKLQGNAYRSYNFENHIRSKMHHRVVESLNRDSHPYAAASVKANGGRNGGGRSKAPVRRSHTPNNKQSRPRTKAPSSSLHREGLTTRSLTRSFQPRLGGNKSNDAGMSGVPGGSSRVPVQPSAESTAPGTSAVQFQAGSSGIMEGVVTVDGQRRKVIECTISEGFAPKKMDISLTF